MKVILPLLDQLLNVIQTKIVTLYMQGQGQRRI